MVRCAELRCAAHLPAHPPPQVAPSRLPMPLALRCAEGAPAVPAPYRPTHSSLYRPYPPCTAPRCSTATSSTPASTTPSGGCTSRVAQVRPAMPPCLLPPFANSRRRLTRSGLPHNLLFSPSLPSLYPPRLEPLTSPGCLPPPAPSLPVLPFSLFHRGFQRNPHPRLLRLCGGPGHRLRVHGRALAAVRGVRHKGTMYRTALHDDSAGLHCTAGSCTM